MDTIAHVLQWIIPGAMIIGLGLLLLDMTHHPLSDSARTLMAICLVVTLIVMVSAIFYGMIVGLRPFHWAVQAAAWFLLIGLFTWSAEHVIEGL